MSTWKLTIGIEKGVSVINLYYENIQLISGSSTSKNFDKSPLGFRKFVWIL